MYDQLQLEKRFVLDWRLWALVVITLVFVADAITSSTLLHGPHLGFPSRLVFLRFALYFAEKTVLTGV